MAAILDALGNPVFPLRPPGSGVTSFLGSYLASINVRHTAADAAGSYVFGMHNPNGSGKVVAMRRMWGIIAFDGTAAAAGNVGYEFVKGTAADPTTGTTVPIVKKRNAYTASVIAAANIQAKSGVLTFAPTGATVFGAIRLPVSVTNGVSFFEYIFSTAAINGEDLELAADDVLGIRLNPGAAVIGTMLVVNFDWDERS